MLKVETWNLHWLSFADSKETTFTPPHSPRPSPAASPSASSYIIKLCFLFFLSSLNWNSPPLLIRLIYNSYGRWRRNDGENFARNPDMGTCYCLLRFHLLRHIHRAIDPSSLSCTHYTFNYYLIAIFNLFYTYMYIYLTHLVNYYVFCWLIIYAQWLKKHRKAALFEAVEKLKSGEFSFFFFHNRRTFFFF